MFLNPLSSTEPACHSCLQTRRLYNRFVCTVQLSRASHICSSKREPSGATPLRMLEVH